MGRVALLRQLSHVAVLCTLALVASAPANAAVPPDVGPPTVSGAPPHAGPPIAPSAQVGPAAPTGLAALAGHESVTLTWDVTTDTKVIALRIQRDGVQVAELAPTDVTWLDSGRVVGQAYSYTMSAVGNGGKVSPLTAPVVATALDLQAPAAPASLTATAGDGAVDLSWTPVADAAQYRVYADGAQVLSVGAATTTVTGLTNGQPYRFTVAAVDASGNESSPSPEAVATPIDQTPPPVPANVQASPGDGHVTITWDAVADAGLAGYRLYQGDTLLREVDAATLSATVDGLVNGVEVTFSVSAVDDWDNESARSPAVTLSPQDGTPPAVPSNLTAAAGDASATVTWDLVDDADLAGYRVYVEGVVVADIPAGTTTATIPDLTNGQEYDVTITAYDGSGNESAASAPVTVTPQAPPPPVEPGDLPLGLIAADAFTADRPDLAGSRTSTGDFAWTLRGLTNSNESGMKIVVEGGRTRGTVVQDWFTAARVVNTGTREGSVSLDVSSVGAVPAGERAGVIARHRDGQPGIAAFYESVATSACATGVRANAPTIGSACVSGYGRITLSVSGDTAAVLHDGGLVIAGRITGAAELAADATGWGIMHVRGSSSTLALRGDNFAVHGADGPVAPRVPGGVIVRPSEASVAITWNAVGDADLDGYRVLLDGVPAAQVDAPATSATITGLEAGRTYAVTVTAVDRFGHESAPSAPPVRVTPGRQVAFDEFTVARADLSGSATPVGGFTWGSRGSSSTDGTMKVFTEDGQARGTFHPTNTSSARVIDVGLKDLEVSADVTAAGALLGGESAGVIARQAPGFSGLAATYLVVATTTCASRIQLTMPGVSPVCVDGLGRVTLRVVGNAVTLLHNGVVVRTHTITDAAQLGAAATRWGLIHRKGGSSLTLRMDNFAVDHL